MSEIKSKGLVKHENTIDEAISIVEDYAKANGIECDDQLACLEELKQGTIKYLHDTPAFPVWDAVGLTENRSQSLQELYHFFGYLTMLQAVTNS